MYLFGWEAAVLAVYHMTLHFKPNLGWEEETLELFESLKTKLEESRIAELESSSIRTTGRMSFFGVLPR